MRNFAAAAILFLSPIHAAAAQWPISQNAACDAAKTPSRYVGKSFQFRAEFSSDYRHGSRLRPLGCEHRFAVDLLSEQVEGLILPQGFYMGRPWSEKIVVTVKGVVTVREANGGQFQNDDGVRFDMLHASELQIIDVGYPKSFR